MKKIIFTLLILLCLFSCSNDFKEPGFYIEHNGEINKLTDPHKGVGLELDNLQKNLVNLDNVHYKLYAYFPNFQEFNLYFYTPEIWNIYEAMPSYSSTEKDGRIFPAYVQVSKNLYQIDYRDMPYDGIVAMAYYQTPADAELSAIAFDDFNALVNHALNSSVVDTEKQTFAHLVKNMYPERKDLVRNADKFLQKIPRLLEREQYLKAKNSNNKKEKEKLLQRFISNYPKSSYRSRAESALESVRSSKRSSSYRSTQNEPIDTHFLKKDLTKLLRNYVSSVNSGNYSQARELATSRALSMIATYERRSTILQSKEVGELKVSRRGATLKAGRGQKETRFTKVNGVWKVSSY